MSAFEKYEQMRRAAEAARAAGTPETAAQQTQRLIQESGALRAAEEIQRGLGKPYNNVVQGLDGSVTLQFGDSQYDYQSVRIGAGRSGGTIRVSGADSGYNPAYPNLGEIHHLSWDRGQEAGRDRIEREVAGAFLRPQDHHSQPPPRQAAIPIPTPPSPPEKPKGFLRRLIFGKNGERPREEKSGFHEWYDTVKDIHER